MTLNSNFKAHNRSMTVAKITCRSLMRRKIQSSFQSLTWLKAMDKLFLGTLVLNLTALYLNLLTLTWKVLKYFLATSNEGIQTLCS